MKFPPLPSSSSQNLAASPCWLRRLFLACVAVCPPNPKEARRCLACHAHAASAEMEYLLEEAFPTTLANSVGLLASAHSWGNDSFVHMRMHPHKDERLWIATSSSMLISWEAYSIYCMGRYSISVQSVRPAKVTWFCLWTNIPVTQAENIKMRYFTKSSSGIDTSANMQRWICGRVQGEIYNKH